MIKDKDRTPELHDYIKESRERTACRRSTHLNDLVVDAS